MGRLVSDKYEAYKAETNARFDKLKANEEELNRIFIDIYGLQDELTPDVADKDVTVARIYDTKEEIPDSMKGNNYVLTKQDVVKSLISYAVGCMMGRYSLDVDGLAYAGGDWDNSKYKTFQPDSDAIIPICDDEYFDDDIVSCFVRFVEAAYGKDTLEANLKFIADALGGNGTPREIIRGYFLSGFFADHVKTYKKRPIYWLFDSGKKNGFKALVYMHRWNKDIEARVRTFYLHKAQEKYENEVKAIDAMIGHMTDNRMIAREKKRQTKLKNQIAEIVEYDEVLDHIANEHIDIDLDDGVKVNYEKVQTDSKGKKFKILAPIK